MLTGVITLQAQPTIVQPPNITVIKDDYVTPEVDRALRGTWGGEIISFSIQYNGQTSLASLDGGDLEFVGLSGDATGKIIPVALTESYEFDGQIWGLYEVGPFDASANGDYVFRLKANEVHNGGDPLVAIPETEFFQFEQDITDPVGGVSSYYIGTALDIEGNVIDGIQGEFGLGNWGLLVYYDQAVDWDSIDINDIVIEGIDGDALGHVYPVFPNESTFSEESQVEFIASLAFGPLDAAYNGTYAVKIVANEVFDRGEPPTALEPQVIFTFAQNITNPFRATIQGRAFLETGTPKFADDGWETDPGLEVKFLLETPFNGGFGYQLLYFNTSISGSKATGYNSVLADITGAQIGEASNGGFQIAGDQSLTFPVGSAIIVSGSSGNNGTYTVSSVQVAENITFLGVEEAVPSSDAGGKIARAYKVDITIDGELIPVSISGAASQTFPEMIYQLNAVLGNKGYAVVETDRIMTIESPSFGPNSTVSISDPGGINGLFSNLPDHSTSPPYAGNSDFQFSSQNEFYSEEEDLEQNKGRFEFTIQEPGIYRVRAWVEETFDGNETIWNPPYAEWIEQALGDPTRIGFPKDHSMYVLANRGRTEQIIVRNFPYKEETNSPEPVEDSFQVLKGSINQRLDVLANDGDATLSILGLAEKIDEDLFPGAQSIPGLFLNTITTDGQYVYYSSPFQMLGIEIFYYVVEDGQGNRDFAKVTVNNVTEITDQFVANDDFATVALDSVNTEINVLANDSVVEPVTKSQLRITETGTSQNGGRIIVEDNQIYYTPPPGYLGEDFFTYSMTDDVSGSQTARVSVLVIPVALPISNEVNGLFWWVLSLLKDSPLGNLVLQYRDQHRAEVTYLLADQGSQLQRQQSDSGGTGVGNFHLRSAGTSETQAKALEVIAMLEPGIKAMITGQGDQVMVSEEMITKMGEIKDYLLENGSPQLVEAIRESAQDFGYLEEFSGKSFEESAEKMGIDPESVSIPTILSKLSDKAFSITTYDAAGFIFKLWKSTTLQPDSWEEITDAEVTTDGRFKTLTDPEYEGDRNFYRITGETEQ